MIFKHNFSLTIVPSFGIIRISVINISPYFFRTGLRMVSIGLVSYFIRMVTWLLIKNLFLTIIFLLLQNSLPLYLVLSRMLFKVYNSALTSSESGMPLPDPVDT